MAMDEHNKLLEKISRQVRIFYDDGIPFRIYHGSTNSTRMIKKDPDRIIDTSTLNRVLSIDGERLTAIVEPNVPMDILVDLLMPHGLIPRVVPEFPGITVGGSYSGTAAESSSFRDGYFDRTINWVEIVLANGEVIKASSSDNADIFYGAAGALGTLGVTTLFEIKLMRVRNYVEVEYKPTRSVSETIEKLAVAERDEDMCFLDAILFSKDAGVVVVGRIREAADSTVLPTIQFSRPQDPWFFLHAHSKLQHTKSTDCFTCSLLRTHERYLESPPLIEGVPTKDYLFRYDRGAFWMGAYGWNMMPLPFNQFGRKMLDPLFRTRKMYAIMHHSGQSQRFVVQDLAIPIEKGEEFVHFLTDEIRISPLWLCPIRGNSPAPLHTAKDYTSEEEKLKSTILNIGLWGIPYRPNGTPIYYGRNNFDKFIALNQRIEAKVLELDGLKWLYAHNYNSEDQFWESYDKEAYEKLRTKWHAEKLPSIWDKVKRDDREWKPTNVIRGMWMGLMGKEYLVKTK